MTNQTIKMTNTKRYPAGTYEARLAKIEREHQERLAMFPKLRKAHGK